MRRTFASVVALVLVVAATACSGSRSDQNVEITDANNPAEWTVQVEPKQVIDHLKAAGLPIERTDTYTVDNDPYALAGRPDRYQAKVVFHDTRFTSPLCEGELLPWDECGGTVETFANASDLRKWTNAIVIARQQTPNAPPEYRYQNGLSLLRLGHVLTPDQAKAYEQAYMSFSPPQGG